KPKIDPCPDLMDIPFGEQLTDPADQGLARIRCGPRVQVVVGIKAEDGRVGSPPWRWTKHLPPQIAGSATDNVQHLRQPSFVSCFFAGFDGVRDDERDRWTGVHTAAAWSVHNGFCRKFSFEAICGMVSPPTHAAKEARDDGDQLQRGSLPTRHY